MTKTITEWKEYFKQKFTGDNFSFRPESRWHRVTFGYSDQLDEIFNKTGRGVIFYYENNNSSSEPDLKSEEVIISLSSYLLK